MFRCEEGVKGYIIYLVISSAGIVKYRLTCKPVELYRTIPPNSRTYVCLAVGKMPAPSCDEGSSTNELWSSECHL